ncbi:MAG: phage terminase large subunit family protein [Chlamydiota bacterium]|nr:phage terminase large subunit family protein [Chlamydiota bacterium]
MPIIKNTHSARIALDKNKRVRPYTSTGLPLLEEWDLELERSDVHTAAVSTVMTEVRPTDFVEFAIRIPNQATKVLEPFSFEQRRYLKPVYDSVSPRILLKCGRQVEKSTYLGNRLLALTCIQPNFTALYVSPTNQQTKTFSNDRIKEPLETSDRLRAWTTDQLAQNVFQKKFINRSQIVLRYAFLNADRVRGIPADMVCIDEIQDVLTDNIPVIEECVSHSSFKYKLYSGTPKSLDNTLESLWVEDSTQNEWVVPCDSCGGGDYRHWNILDEANIGPSHLICDNCGAEIYAMHDDAQWASMNPNPRVPHPMDGYRVPQIMVPWCEWDDILNKQILYSRAKFHNEVLGLSYDSGTRPLTRDDIQSNCTDDITLNRSELNNMILKTRGKVVYLGVDWGTGEQTYTVVVVCSYYNNKFTVMYAQRFEGQLAEPSAQLERIDQIIKQWNVQLIGVDYGGGFDRNDAMIRRYGPRKVFKYQYSTITRGKIVWDPGLSRFLVNRTEVMSDVFNAIRRKNVFGFPRWEDWDKPFAADMLNIFSEYSEERRINEYRKSKGVTDDTFHAIVVAFLVSAIKHPRPDVLIPQKT